MQLNAAAVNVGPLNGASAPLLIAAEMAMSGTCSTTFISNTIVFADASWNAEGILDAVATREKVGEADWSALANMTAAAGLQHAVSMAISADGTLAGAPFKIAGGEANLTAVATLLARASQLHQAQGSGTASATATMGAERHRMPYADWRSRADVLTADPVRTAMVEAEWNTVAQLLADARVTRYGSAALSAAGVLSIDGLRERPASADLDASGSFTGTPVRERPVSGEWSASSNLGLTAYRMRMGEMEASATTLLVANDPTRIRYAGFDVSAIAIADFPEPQIVGIELAPLDRRYDIEDVIRLFEVDAGERNFAITIEPHSFELEDTQRLFVVEDAERLYDLSDQQRTFEVSQ